MKYKRVLKTICFFMICGALIFGLKSTKTNAITMQTTLKGLGSSTDMAGSSYLEMKDKYIFNKAWLIEKRSNLNINYTKVGKLEGYKSFVLDSFFDKYAENFYGVYNPDLDYCAIRSDIKSALGFYGLSNYTNAYSSFYYLSTHLYEQYSCSFQYNLHTKHEYIENLDEEYIEALNKVKLNELSYEEFFKLYGSHIVMGGSFGFKSQISEGVLTKESVIDEKIQPELENAFPGTLSRMSQILSNKAFHEKLSEILKTNEYETSITLKNSGDRISTCTNPDDTHMTMIKKDKSRWSNLAYFEPMLIDTYDDALIPLWEMLPKKHEDLRETMKDEFETYNQNQLEIVKKPINKTVLDSFLFDYKLIREDEELIKDTGRFNQCIDSFNFTDFTGRPLEDWKKLGYKNIRVNIKSSIKEVKDGYQYFFLNTDYKEKNNEIAKIKYEHGIGKRNTEYEEVNMSMLTRRTNVDTIDITEFEETMYLLYGASGKYRDHWRNKEVYLSLEFVK